MRRAAVPLALAVALLAASCSSTVQGVGTAASPAASSAAPPAGSSSTAAGVPTKSLQGLSLTASDFPAPYQLQPLQSLPQSNNAVDSIQFSPAGCGKIFQWGRYTDRSAVGVASAFDPASSSALTTVVTPIGVPLEQLDAVLAACPSYTEKAQEAAARAVTVALTRLPNPTVPADLARAFLNLTNIFMLAELRGVFVEAFSSTPAGSRGPDQAVVALMLSKAVAKVAAS
jgi:predicted small secreted protein